MITPAPPLPTGMEIAESKRKQHIDPLHRLLDALSISIILLLQALVTLSFTGYSATTGTARDKKWSNV